MTEMRTVWLAMRDAGALTPCEISRRCPTGYGQHQVGPLIFALCQAGWARPIGKGLARRYVNARLARWYR